MPNIAKVLREEIARISRKEAKIAVTPVRKPSVRLRSDVADLKRRMVMMEQANKQLQACLAKIEAAQPAPPPAEAAEKGWISGQGIKSLRKRLGVSQAEFAKLVGVSGNAVGLWEGKSGMLKLMDATKAKVFAVRGIGAREAQKRLEEMKAAAGKVVKKGKKGKKAAKTTGKRGKR